MKFSIITPTLNSGKTILKNLNSVWSQKIPHGLEVEQIIQDGLSSDNTLDIIENFKKQTLSNIKIFSTKDANISDAFNKGIANSEGVVIHILNSDDFYFHETILATIYDIFLKEKNISLVHGDIYFRTQDGRRLLYTPHESHLGKGIPYNHPSMFVKRSVYEQFGTFNIKYKIAMDFDFVCRFYKNKSIKTFYMQEPLVEMADGGFSSQNEFHTILELHHILKKRTLFSMVNRILIYHQYLKCFLKSLLRSMGAKNLIGVVQKFKYERSNG